MAYDLFVTEAAHEDLEEALGYIAGDLANPSAAANLLDQVEACYEQLKDFPMLYECCHDLQLRNLGYRKVVIGNFVLVYNRTAGVHPAVLLRRQRLRNADLRKFPIGSVFGWHMPKVRNQPYWDIFLPGFTVPYGCTLIAHR